MFFDQLPREVLESELAGEAENLILETSPKRRFYKYNQIIGQKDLVLSHKGYDASSGKDIAWNIIDLARISAKQARNFIKTIKKIKSINSPYVMKQLDYWIAKQRKQLIFISQYMTGGSLKEYLKKIKRPKLNVVKGWCHSVLKAVSSVMDTLGQEGQGLHIFLNCSNIYINSNSNQIKLGLQSFSADPKLFHNPSNIPWIAPESFQNQCNPLSTVYSFGMMLLEMVANKDPYSQCKNFLETAKSILWKTKPGIIKKICNSQVKRIILSCIAARKERIEFKELCSLSFWVVEPQDNIQVEINEKMKDDVFESSQNLEVTKIAQIVHKSSNHSSHKSLQNEFEALFNYKTQANKNFNIRITSSQNERAEFQDFVMFFINKLDARQSATKANTANTQYKQELSQVLFTLKNSFTQKYRQYSSQIEGFIGESSGHATLWAKKMEMEHQQIINLQKDLELKMLQKSSRNKKSPFGLDVFDIINFNLSTVEVREVKKGLSSTSDIFNFSCSSIYPQNQSQKSEDFELDLQRINITNRDTIQSVNTDRPHADFEDDLHRISSQNNVTLSKLKSCQWNRSQKIEFQTESPKQ